MPTINLTDDELAAVTAAIRRTLEDDRFPHAPTLKSVLWSYFLIACCLIDQRNDRDTQQRLRKNLRASRSFQLAFGLERPGFAGFQPCGANVWQGRRRKS